MLLTRNNFFANNSIHTFTKAEPFKMWLAEVGKERIDETIDPELALIGQ